MCIEKIEVVSSEDGQPHVQLRYVSICDTVNKNNGITCSPVTHPAIKEVKLDFNFATPEHQAFSIHFSKNYLQRWNDIPLLNQFLTHLSNHENAELLAFNRATTPAMRCIIHDMLFCAYTGSLRKMYLEAKILELLCYSLHQHHDPLEEDTLLPKADIEKIQLAHAHILENLSDPGSIFDLARLAGINEHKLKKGFKKLYGSSILAFIIDSRLHHAKSLLLQSEHSIKSIAIMMGYRDRSNFTAAFRKKFGYAPCILRS